SVGSIDVGVPTRDWVRKRSLLQRVRSAGWGARIGWLVLLIGVGYLVLRPLVKLQQKALAAHSYSRMWDDPQFGSIVRNTVLLAVGSVVIALVVGTLMAWSAYNLPRRLRFLAVLPILSIMVPPLAQVTGWVFLFSRKVGYLNTFLRHLPWWSSLRRGPVDVNTLPWIVIITAIMLVPFVYLFVLTSLRAMDASTFEAAAISGAGSTKSFVQIILPSLRPALVYSGSICLVLGLGQFTAPLILGRQAEINVITTSMYAASNSAPPDFGLASAYGSPLLILGVLVILVQRMLTKNRERYQTLSTRGHRSANAGHKLAAVPILAYVFIAIMLPIAALLVVGLSPFWSGTIDFGAFTLNNFRKAYHDPNVVSAVKTTLDAVVIATAIVVPLGFACATAMVTRRGPGKVLRAIYEFLVGLPLSVPGIVFGAGILYAYSQGSIILYGGISIFVVAYVTALLPFVTRMMQSGLVSTGESVVEASRVAGAGVIRTQLAVVVPIMRGSIAAAAGVALALLSQEFAASSMVRSREHNSLGPLFYDVWSQGYVSQASVLALTMCAISVVTVAVAMAIGGRGAVERATNGGMS
ncbi:MAG TPA: ABC transporter permease subunit, partial [Ilumatobacteraceae bacterium]